MQIMLSQHLFYTWVEIGPQSLMIWVQSLSVWLWGGYPYPLGHHVACMPNCDWLWQVLYRMSHFGVSLCCLTVYWAFFVMALCELSYGNFHMPRRRVVTYEEVFAKTELSWVTRYERDGVPTRDILARRVFVDRFCAVQPAGSSHQPNLYFLWQREGELDSMEELLLQDREKLREKLIQCSDTHKEYNCLGVGCKTDSGLFCRKIVCWRFEPFHKHWNRRQEKRAKWTVTDSVLLQNI